VTAELVREPTGGVVDRADRVDELTPTTLALDQSHLAGTCRTSDDGHEGEPDEAAKYASLIVGDLGGLSGLVRQSTSWLSRASAQTSALRCGRS
jgi:hypothetical protein